MPSETTVSERDVLLATKLHVPSPRPGVVHRPRLAARLEEGLERGLALVCAPAGYGKTVLLAEWAKSGQRPTAWLSLDPADNDPARFWRHVVAALGQVRRELSARVAPMLGPPAPASFEPLLAALVNEMAAQPGDEEALLVLDDYHLISAPQVHESVGFLVGHRPPSLVVVLASRSDPPLALARLRAGGQLAELRAADLRFTPGEAAELLQHTASSLSDASVAALAARTEGWAAGLQLAALSLRGQDDVPAFVAAFTGSNRYVLDFLTEEVLDRQSGQLRTFLLETSVLDRLSGPLCDAVTGRGDSQALLEQVERAGLFLVPLDDVRGWWRYHHLFAELLRARLGRPSERAAALHHNAAAWYERHGLADDAIGHAVAAGDMVWAARIIEKYFDEFYFLRGEVATIRQWLSALPADLIRSRVRLLLAQAHMAATSGRGEAVEPLLDAAERAAAGSGEDPFESSAGQAASWLVNPPALTILLRSYLATLRGDAESTAELASRGRAEIRAGEWMLSYTADGLLADAEWLRGRLASAERMFVPRLARWREAGVPTMMAWVCDELTQIQRAQGHLDEAARTGRQVLEITALPGGAHLAAAGSAYVALADVAYQRNDLDTALHDVTEGIALCRQFVYAPPLARGLATLAWIRQAKGDPAGAREAMAEAAHAAPGPVGLVNPAPALRARLLLAQGDVTAGVRFVQENRLGPDDKPNFAREAGYLVLARVLLAQGRSAQALTLLDRLHTAAAAQDRVGSVIEVGALRALARSAAGDEPGAVMALAGTLTLACPQGYVRVFADEGAPMATLLGRLIAAQRTTRAVASVTLGYLARLQRAFGVGPSAPDSGPPGIVDPLTTREFEVLEMLAAGRSNQAIARELVVTLDTVKKHVGHVLGKLGAANRTEAVARARELNLIP